MAAGEQFYVDGTPGSAFFRRMRYHRPKDGIRQATTNAAIALNIP
jgi:hypothetical protein